MSDVQACFDLLPKLHVLINTFAAFQKYESTLASYTLQTSAHMHNLRSEGTRLGLFICGLSMIQSSLSKLYITN